ncbi:MAG: CPBP family intramembrane metalloprotease [Gammaproteobacteria bacterium]|nr:CPBP family intramembrane metalloprotease [Gammaproteobacteria bacterium]
MRSMHYRPRKLLTLVMLFEGSLLPLAWILAWLLELPLLLTPGLPVIGLGILATLPMWWLLHWSRGLDLGPLSELFGWVESNLLPLFKGASTLQLAAIAVLAGLGEEMLFRGVIQQALQQWLGPWAGLLLASLVFGAAHWVSRTYMVFASLMGLYLGLLYWLSGDLLLAAIVHALYDFLALRMLLGQPTRTEING